MPALILIVFEKRISFLFTSEAVFTRYKLLFVAFKSFFRTLFSLEFCTANICHFFNLIISSFYFKFSDVKLFNFLKRIIAFEVIETGKDTILVTGFTISEEIDLS